MNTPSDTAGASRSYETEPVAIIGIGCRFPGGVNGPESFWNALVNGLDAIAEIPASRFDINAFYDSKPATPGKVMTRWGGFLDDIDKFDALFFGISPREADRMDPQQRLLLETAWEALEDAGQAVDKLAGSQTGVFVGLWLNDYEARMFDDPALVDFYMTTGSGRYSASGRLSYAFGFQGPSLTLDCACSSSLVAIHLACQSLRAGECSLALAGGANVILQPHITIAYSQSKMMAPDGRCKFGDARADGYVRSEGAGVVALKRLSQAIADGDPIYAVIRGSAVNNDGRTSGFLATPGQEGQEDMLVKAYRRAGVDPSHVHYVEAHGTGTAAGDPVELGALGAVLGKNRPGHRPCIVGSVKTNFGHTEGAAGVAGLIKVALSLKHKQIPATLHFQTPNPNIPWDDLKLTVKPTLTPWPAGSGPALPPVAGVSSFGIAGTNAHVVLQEAPELDGTAPLPDDRVQLLPLSAHTPEALQALARAYHQLLREAANNQLPITNNHSLHDFCYTASARRAHHDHRLALVAHNREELADHLQAFLQGEARPGLSSDVKSSERKIVFVFPGQGSQWFGMGRQLLAQEPVFRETLEQCEKAFQALVDWSLIAELTAGESKSRLNEIDVIQPALFAIEVALAALWRSWGVEPDAVVGHSMGEIAAAHVAGALTLEDAARIICGRSKLLKRVSGQGGMAVVEFSFDEAGKAIAGYEDRLSIAVSNSPRSTVLSGDPAALDEVIAKLQKQEVFCRWVKVDVASHSPQMDPLRADLLQLLGGLQPRKAATPIYSTVTNETEDGAKLEAAYWVNNLRQPVRFWPSIQRLLADGHDIFIELSPHPILLPAIQQGLQQTGQSGAVLPSLRREEEERAAMLGSLGALYTLGRSIDWGKLYPDGGQIVSLPLYPWQREHFWVDDLEKTAKRRVNAGHPLLDQHFKSSVHADTHFWEVELGLDALPYLADHRVQDSVILPAAAFVEMALAAASEAFGEGRHELTAVAFKEALVIREDETRMAQVVISPETIGVASLQVLSREPSQSSWTLHAEGRIRVGSAEAVAPAEQVSIQEIQARCGQPVSGTEHYQAMTARGLHYGPAFQGVEQMWKRENEVVAELRASEGGSYQVHPALLDAALQLLVATLPEETAGETYVPVGAASARLYERPQPGAAVWGYARCQSSVNSVFSGDVLLLDENGRVLLEVKELCLQRLARAAESVDEWLYEIQWQAKERGSVGVWEKGSWLVFADDELGLQLAKLLKARGESCALVTRGDVYKISSAEQYQVNPARPEDFRQLLKDVGPVRGVAYLWSLDALTPDRSFGDLSGVRAHSVLHLVQALAGAGWPSSPRLWLATRNSQPVGGEPVSVAQSPVWGLGGVIANEHPELHCTRIDLGAATEAQSLLEELLSGDDEQQVALRGAMRYAARLAKLHSAPKPQSLITARSGQLLPAGQPFRVEIATPGILDSLRPRAMSRNKPGPGEVEIEVRAAGLNFIDVMKAMGVYPGLDLSAPISLGLECAGVVTALGEGVTKFQVGDEVMAFAQNSLGTHAIANAHLVLPKPPQLNFVEAAAIPIVFLTAYYALHHLGRMRQGERVLIHSAAGGVGLAAVHLAGRFGAEIFATAGSEEKREYLRSLGVQHVMDSRSLAFADEIMQATNGQGVDIVLNSLAGEAITKSLEALAPYGRFVEIGKRDIYQNSRLGLLPFQKNLSYFAVDLDRMSKERPAFLGGLFREVMELFADDSLRPLPHTVFPVSQAAEAFRHMAQALHIGKIVISLDDSNVKIAPAEPALIRADGTYLITGGLGGLGLAMAKWLTERGARHLALMGRSGPSASTAEVVAGLEAGGAQVKVLQADVAEKDQVAAALAELEKDMPPLRGVIHAAGILDDGILLQQDSKRFESVMAPKVSGAWNLHELTSNAPLDFFVLFSSVAATLGTPGQGNYAAGNAFLDSLAHHRRANGLPALSINWGPWSEIGLATRPDRGGRLALRGVGSISPEQGLKAFERLLKEDVPQAVVMPFNAGQWAEANPSSAPFLAQLLDSKSSQPTNGKVRESGVRESLLAVEPGRRRWIVLETYLREQVAQVLRLAPSRIDPNKPLRALGIDSLMTLELRNRLEAGLGLTLSATLVWNYPTVSALIPFLAGKMEINLETAEPESEAGSKEESAIDQMSQDEVEKMLAAELDSIDDLLRGDT
jgi:acyl transferase domain-containing protein/acyl carrier protein